MSTRHIRRVLSKEILLLIGRPAILLTVLAIVSGTALLIALASGSADISLAEMLAGLRGDASEKVQDVVINLRLPRALTAFAVGGLLAVAGVLMQVLLRNPLAEPYILGTSGGAAVAA
ncbi:MAG: iron chelate uptake ABC transporter family permease subunit, partial [Proteobacteria bacterium]|nr:iron chelate uptake ABC transporter family permease subunit [Pseudomonadota bacterium]